MTPKQIRERLKGQGYSYRSFAKQYGFSEWNVSKAVRRWSERTDSIPHGDTAKICVKLSQLLGEPVGHPLISHFTSFPRKRESKKTYPRKRVSKKGKKA